MTKEEYQEKLRNLINSESLDSELRQKVIKRWELVKEIWEFDYCQNRVDWLKKLAEETIIFIDSGFILTNNDVKDLAIGVYQLIFWLEEIKNETISIN